MKAPENHRLLIQLVDAATEQDARRELTEIFGERAASVAMFFKGTIRHGKERKGNLYSAWHEVPTGFRLFVPQGFKL